MAELNTVARPYTKAAFEYARDKGNLDQWSNLLSLSAQAVQDSELARVLSNPALTVEQKAELVIAICEQQIDDAGKNFIFLLAENRRLALLPEIAAQFAILKANLEKKVDVDLTTAFALDDAQQEKLAKALSSKLGREVKLTSQVDKSIIGGVVVRSDDLVIDGSVRARLAKLAEAMNS
ncbi:F0F1 ATP synthase subunit delta [Marinobacterium sediminicola]|uniref:ATP synthase subunit delta n=1 Tax=Marinobacterium sediminicola TaxID=518898 RepID=A0ABY1S409_9GAMM|nr:F0F1 ATP synthase subunit delta [Marinobacterium sediminicola]ULG69219.1 F0F1 ATP synthase subunit delta [Marinobacterium sediminicola]SMR78310.1 ATP synthase F1 subcomplex delta subunit [Marinobacterium sediminicola]